MHNNEFGRQREIYSYKYNRYFVLIILIFAVIGVIWFNFAVIRGMGDYSSTLLIILSIMGLVIFIVVHITEWKHIQNRIIVYEYGLRLEIQGHGTDFAITDITDMHFMKEARGHRGSSYHFLFYVKLQNGRSFEMNLQHFESFFSGYNSRINNVDVPNMPELVSFYDRWNKSRNVTVNIKR